MGFAVFADTPEKGIGLSYMLGPSGGYLFGFLIAAFLCGWLAERGWDRTFYKTIGIMLIGNFVIYTFGISWLLNFLEWRKAFELGFYPFLIPDLLKIIFAASIMPLVWRTLDKEKIEMNQKN